MNQIAAKMDDAPLDAVILYVVTGVFALGALLATAFTQDPLFRFHGYVFLAAFITAFAVMTVAISSGKLGSPQDRYADGVVRA